MTDLTGAARSMVQAGFSVIPCHATKKATIPWKQYQNRLMTEEEIVQHFTGAERLATVCGAISGNLEYLDFDDPETYSPFLELVESQQASLTAKLPKRQTPSGGYHLVYRCETPIQGNLKLACSKDQKVRIETRGEGGYALAPPSSGYSIIEHSLLKCPTLTAEEVSILHSAAKAFDLREQWNSAPSAHNSNGNDRPGDQFNAENTIPELLLKYGWREDRKTSSGMGYTRPGKDHSTSGVLLEETGNFYCWSSNAHPLEPGKSYNAFALFTAYEHGGDYSAAARSISKAEDFSHAHVDNPTHPSFSSLSNSYTSPYPSSTLHPVKSFLIIEAGGKKRLVPQSKAAEAIGGMIQGSYAYSMEAAVWYRFDSNHWRICSPSEVESEITDLIYNGAGELGFSSNYPHGVMALLRTSKAIFLPQQNDRHIPFRNGLLEISTMKLVPIQSGNAMTWILPCDYQKDALCPNFLKWLEISVEGDQETIRLLRAWINAVLVGRPELQRFLHLLGPAGTGKSTLLRLIFQLVGKDNFTTTSLKQLETNRFEAANIYGKRLVSIEEADKYGGSVSVLKSMTGQDPLRLERKNQQQQGSFIFDGQVLITSNERFASNDNSNGIERRRMTVDFKHWITPDERAVWDRRGGEEKILWPEIPGIINWALQLQNDEVKAAFRNMPDRIRKANLEAARVNNSVLDWMVNNLLPDETASAQVGDRREIRTSGEIHFQDEDTRLYPNYLYWSVCNGRKPVSTRSFTDILLEQARTYGITCRKVRKKDGTMIEGLRIRQDFDDSWLSLLENAVKGEGSVKGEVKDNLLIMHEMNGKGTFSTSPTKKNIIEVLI